MAILEEAMKVLALAGLVVAVPTAEAQKAVPTEAETMAVI